MWPSAMNELTKKIFKQIKQSTNTFQSIFRTRFHVQIFDAFTNMLFK